MKHWKDHRERGMLPEEGICSGVENKKGWSWFIRKYNSWIVCGTIGIRFEGFFQMQSTIALTVCCTSILSKEDECHERSDSQDGWTTVSVKVFSDAQQKTWWITHPHTEMQFPNLSHTGGVLAVRGIVCNRRVTECRPVTAAYWSILRQ